MRIGKHFIGPYGQRRYYMKASAVYGKLMQQAGFAACGGSRIRRALREALKPLGRAYLSPPGYFHDPVHDEQTGFYDVRQQPEALGYPAGTRVVERYSWQCIVAVAHHMPFQCPLCGGNESPLADLNWSLPWFDEEQLICLRCWNGYGPEMEARLEDIEKRIKKLNKGIENVKQRRRQAHERAALAASGDQATGGDLRHAGSAHVADQGISGFECGSDHAEQGAGALTNGESDHRHGALGGAGGAGPHQQRQACRDGSPSSERSA
jgi:hypothetical protein